MHAPSLAVVAVLVVSLTSPADALLCQKRNGAVFSRETCRKRETPLAGTPGPQGPMGDDGPPGPQGPAAWETIPSGVTVTGAFVNDSAAAGVGQDYWYTVNYPAMLPADPTEVGFAPDGSAATSEEDANCTGTFTAPTAPAGRVCVYLSQSSGVTAGSLRADALGIAPRNAFVITWTSSVASGDLNVWATWAYTAP